MSFDKIPDEMKQYAQFVVWRFEDKESIKPTKVPYCANTGRHASTNNPETWCSFDHACHAARSDMYDGIGFVLTDNDPFAFIDLDDTKGDASATTRQIEAFNRFDSFAERSPSGKGLHIIVKGKIPSGRKRSFIEIYSSGRYMTMTGEVFRDSPIKDYNELLNALYAQIGKGKEAKSFYAGLDKAECSDDEILTIATNAANGPKFKKLWAGDWSDYQPNATNSASSEADFALVDIIAFYSKNREQVKRMFRHSGLGQRLKAQREDYMKWMLDRCFDNMLPPVDIEGLQNQLSDSIAARKKEAMVKTAEAKEIIPSNDIYSVPPGLVGEIAKFIYAQSPRPVPEIALCGAIGVMAGIVGKAYNVSATGLNQYTLLLAATGTGKEAMAGGIDKLFAEIVKTVPLALEFVGPGEIASPQAIRRYMSNGPTSFISIIAEFGIYLQGMACKNAPPHLTGLRRFLLDAYGKSGAFKVLRPSIYSDKVNNTTAIEAPAFSLLGESTPEEFYDGLHEGLISQGLLPRFTIVEYHGKRPANNDKAHLAKPSFDLIEKSATLCAHALGLNNNNKVINVGFTDDAKGLFDRLDIECDMKINGSDKEVKRHLWNRAHLKSMKLAALVAVGCNFYNPTITAEIGVWAIAIVKADVQNLLERFNEGTIGVDNDEMLQLGKVCEVVKRYILAPWQEVAKQTGEKLAILHSNKIIPYAYIQRNLSSIAVFRKDRMGPTFAIKRAIKTLGERGDMEEIPKPKLSKEYGTTAMAYMVSNLKAFEL